MSAPSRHRFSPATFLLVVLCLLLPLAAKAARGEGSGATTTEHRVVDGFRNVSLGIAADVELRQGAMEGVTLTGDDAVLPRVETVVRGDTLEIRWAHGHPDATYRKLKIVVEARAIEGVTVGGSGTVHAARIAAGTFRVTLGGSGSVTVDALEAAAAHVTLAGSGDARLAGRADSLEVTLAGSGDLAAGGLATRRARVTVQGSGRAAVRASDALDAVVAGSGGVTYFGRPAVRQTLLGSGSVQAAAAGR